MSVLLIGLATLLGAGITAQVETCCDPECVNGWCHDGTCRCDALNNIVWEGDACDVRRELATCPELTGEQP
jgi:hypothetical protein